MWVYQKKLQYPVNIKQSNPAIAKLIMSQLGGPHGEKGAAPQQRVLPPVFPAEVAVDMGKGLHGLTPFPCPG